MGEFWRQLFHCRFDIVRRRRRAFVCHALTRGGKQRCALSCLSVLRWTPDSFVIHHRAVAVQVATAAHHSDFDLTLSIFLDKKSALIGKPSGGSGAKERDRTTNDNAL